MALTLSQRELWSRIASFPLDLPNHRLTYTRRLGREQGWPAAFAERVVGEYRRFLLLAATGDAMMVPSDTVDQAWHLHLLDTRAYWDDLCGAAIGKPIHHTPARGGCADDVRHRVAYDATLRRYRTMFDEAPPADIWPQAGERFGGHWRRVDLERAWVVPKLRWRTTGAALVAALAVVGCATASPGLIDVLLLGFLGVAIALMIHATRVDPHRRDRNGNGGCAGGLGCSPGDGGGCSGGCGGCG